MTVGKFYFLNMKIGLDKSERIDNRTWLSCKQIYVMHLEDTEDFQPNYTSDEYDGN